MSCRIFYWKPKDIQTLTTSAAKRQNTSIFLFSFQWRIFYHLIIFSEQLLGLSYKKDTETSSLAVKLLKVQCQLPWDDQTRESSRSRQGRSARATSLPTAATAVQISLIFPAGLYRRFQLLQQYMILKKSVPLEQFHHTLSGAGPRGVKRYD